MSRRNAIVVGGGIGGLAAALALLRRGWDVEVLERAAAFEEVGAGLSVWPNALRALEALGLGEQIRAQALAQAQAGIRHKSGRWLARTDTDEITRRYGPLVMVHRARLLDLLRTALPAAALRAGVEVTRVATDATTAELAHTDGVSRADLVVGADGIRSAVRRSLWPDAPQPRFAGYTAWRLVSEPRERISAGGETWGRGERFGIAPLRDGRVYGFGVANRPARERLPGGELAELRRRFGDWHDPIPALLDAAREDAVLRQDIEELPPLTTYVGGRIALLTRIPRSRPRSRPTTRSAARAPSRSRAAPTALASSRSGAPSPQSRSATRLCASCPARRSCARWPRSSPGPRPDKRHLASSPVRLVVGVASIGPCRSNGTSTI